MSSSPALSVIVTAFNVVHWIDECLSSVLDTEDERREIIVIDDGSTDGTWEIIEEYAARDARLRAVRSPFRGGAAARNHGIALARAPYLAFVDGDDIVPRGSHSALLDAARSNDAEVAVGDFLKFSSTRTWSITKSHGAYVRAQKVTKLDETPRLIRNRPCWNRVFSREFLLRENIEFPEVARSNDIVPMTRVLTRARRISVVPRAVYLYRTRPGASSMTAAAGKAAAFASYLTQETACAELIAASSAAVQHEYWWMVLRSDAWNHLRGFLRADVTPERSDEEELARALGQLVSLCSVRDADTRSATQRLLFALAQRAEWDLARTLVELDSGLEELSDERRREIARAWCAAAIMVDDPALDGESFRRAVLGAVIAGAYVGHDAERRELAELYAQIASRVPSFALLPWEKDALELLRADSDAGSRAPFVKEDGAVVRVEQRLFSLVFRFEKTGDIVLVTRSGDVRLRRWGRRSRAVLRATALRPGDQVFLSQGQEKLAPIPLGRVTASELTKILSPLRVDVDDAHGGVVVTRRKMSGIARRILRKLRGR